MTKTDLSNFTDIITPTEKEAIMAQESSQSLASYLQVSESSQILKVGNNNTISYQDLREYKNIINAKRRETLAELAQQAQELNMGY